MSELLIDKKEYLTAGIHIGMKSKNKDMERFIYKIREDGLAVLNLQVVDERIRIAADFLSRAKTILLVGRKSNSFDGIKKFGEAVEGSRLVVGRFMPGTLTNPHYSNFIEPDVIVLSDPQADYQALKEAAEIRVPVVALCDTFNETKNIDYVIPCNNKGKKSVSLIFWLLAKKINEIKGNKEFKYKLEDFGFEQ